MGFRRVVGFGMAALAFAGSLAADPAHAVPITLYAHVDFGADYAAARERIGGVSEIAEVAPDVAFDLAPKPSDPMIAPLAVSFRRWDEGLIGMTRGAAVAPDEPGR